MTTPPPVAQEAMQSTFSGYLEQAGSQPGAEEVTWAAYQAGWWQALGWAAQQATGEADRGQKTGLDRIALRAFAEQLRQEPGRSEGP